MDAARRRVIPESDCCDSCPFAPTCEEERDFLASVGLGEEWGEEYADG